MGLVKRRQGKLDEAIDLQFQAVRLDPRNEDIWANLGFTYRGMRKLPDARAMLDRALAIAPNEKSLLARKAETYIVEGDLSAARRIHDQMQPRFGEGAYDAAIWVLELERKYDEAIAKITADLKAADSPDPEAVALAHFVVGALHIVSGRPHEGQPLLLQTEAEIRALRDGGSNNPALTGWLLEIQALLGNRAEVERLVAELVASHAKDRWRGPGAEQAATRAYMLLGDRERVIANLERLLVEPSGNSWTPALLRMDPLWDPIRNDPRFQKLAAGKP
jgi:serine/threonine-protein kinase